MFPASLSLAILALSLSAASVPALSVSPYGGIMDRNVFGLKAPPPPPDPNANKPPEAPSNIILTGITTILGNKRALLKVSVPARPPEPAKDESYMLTEGQRDGSVEVLAINEREGSVRVNNAGQITTLTFDKNGAKPVAAAAVPGLPVPRQIPPPAGFPGAPGAGAPGMAHPIPTRTIRTEVQSGSSTEPFQQPNVTDFSGEQTAIPAPADRLSPEAAALLLEARREKYKQEGNPHWRALPPSILSQRLKQEESGP